MKAWNWNGNKSCEMTEEARALRDKMPPLHSALTCTNTSRRVVALEMCVCVHLSAFGSRGFAGEGSFSFQFIVWFLVFFSSSPAPHFADADTSLFLARKAAYCLHPEKQCQYHSLDGLVGVPGEHFG